MRQEDKDHRDTDARPGTSNLEPGTRNARRNVPELADALKAGLERLHGDVKSLAEAVEGENLSLVALNDGEFSTAQGAKESALEGIAQAKAEVVGVMGDLEFALALDPRSLTVASLSEHLPQHDWAYVQALAESVSATMEAVQAKSGLNVEMVRVRLEYFDFLSDLILKTWESETGGSATGGDSVSVIVDRRA